MAQFTSYLISSPTGCDTLKCIPAAILKPYLKQLISLPVAELVKHVIISLIHPNLCSYNRKSIIPSY